MERVRNTSPGLLFALMQARQDEIVSTLTHKLRLLTLGQIARTWWAETSRPEENARRSLAQVVACGLLRRIRVNARPELLLRSPVVRWSPSDPEPPFGRVAYRLQTRWNEAPMPTEIYSATTKAGKVFGGAVGGRLKAPLQASHDLHVSALYLRLRNDDPVAAEAWIAEDRLAPFRRHEKLPDAVLGSGPADIRLVLEFGAGYDKARVRAFHDDCAERGLPYELW